MRDVSQETLLRLARDSHRFDPDRGVRFSTWLFRIAHNLGIDQLRRRRLHPFRDGVELSGGLRRLRRELPDRAAKITKRRGGRAARLK